MLVSATKSAAAAFVSDIAYLRSLSYDQFNTPDVIRRSSAIVRRLLVEGDVRDIAAPRIGRFLIMAMDLKNIWKAEGRRPYKFFMAGGAHAFGVLIWCLHLEEQPARDISSLTDYENKIPLNTDSFLNQRVICLNGSWANRRQIIKYVANVAHGVHSGIPEAAEDLLLARVRRSFDMSYINGKPQMNFDASAFIHSDQPFRYAPDVLDVTLLELLSIINQLTSSPDCEELERIVEAELSNDIR